jgi:hypothetical protein
MTLAARRAAAVRPYASEGTRITHGTRSFTCSENDGAKVSAESLADVEFGPRISCARRDQQTVGRGPLLNDHAQRCDPSGQSAARLYGAGALPRRPNRVERADSERGLRVY